MQTITMTPMELNIVDLIRQGKANKQIAAEINKSLPTVKVYVSKLMKKYNCKNRVQLALMNYT